MTPLQRTAIALWQMDQVAQPTVPAMVAPETSDWREYLPKAHAVIAAIREPTERMKQAGGLQIGLDGHHVSPQIAGWSWDRMIDELLAEGG